MMSEALFGVDRSALDWQAQGLCRRYSPETFLGSDKERGIAKRRREAAAKAICRQCPVMDTCLQWALEYKETGVWGGTTDDERRRRLRADADELGQGPEQAQAESGQETE